MTESTQSADAKWPGGLSAREAEVAKLLARGFRTTEIAKLLGIDVRTVDTHRGNALRKLGRRDTPALVRFAIRTGLVSGTEEADAPGCTDRKKRTA